MIFYIDICVKIHSETKTDICTQSYCHTHQTRIMELISRYGLYKWHKKVFPLHDLTHWGRVTHICVSQLTIIASDNGLSTGRCQAIIRNNAGLWSIETLATNFNKIGSKIQPWNELEIVVCKMAANLSQPQYVKWIICLIIRLEEPTAYFTHFNKAIISNTCACIYCIG